jgi:propionyl-CoA carboxylase beta chain
MMPSTPAASRSGDDDLADGLWDWREVLWALIVCFLSRRQWWYQGLLPAGRQVKPEERAMAREWVWELLDPGSFVVTAADGRAGHGTVDGRPVCVFDGFGHEAVAAFDLALKVGCPLVGAAGGEEDGQPPAGLGELLSRSVLGSGVVPQLSLVMGPCAGAAALVPAMADFTVMVDKAGWLLLGDPDAIRTVTGEEVDADELAGTRIHAARTGTAHFRAADQAEALELARAVLGYLPGNNLEEPPALEPARDPSVVTATDLELDGLLPGSRQLPFDVRQLVAKVVDDGELLEVQALFAGNVLCGFGRVDGRPVGVVANQSLVLAGALDAAGAEKAARFVRTCDAFNLPVVTFVDTPGFLPDGEQERQGLVRRAAKLAYAYAEATVPKVTVVPRQAGGPAAEVMGARRLRADLVLGWPDAVVAGLEAAPATAGGYLHHVVRPAQTRPRVSAALGLLRGKREALPPRRHGNLPL